jgi:Fe-S cluster biogenesis protein NfuA/nitrite reductase/ring-hydroxylating ferredoxin subunit
VEFHEAVAELDTLVRTLEREGDERALMLLELVDAVHRPGLAALAEGNLDHPAAQALLAMYGMTDLDDEELVEEALDSVRPYIHSHGGEVQLLSVQDGVVHVRLSGSCQGCAASSMTLRRGIEEALRAGCPGFREVVAHEPEGPRLIQLEDLRRPVFSDVEQPHPGQLRAAVVDEVPVLLINLAGEVYAFRNGCAVDGLPLEGSRLTDDDVLVCPWHNCGYDARSGKRVDDPAEPGLAVVPVAVEDGRLRVAVNVA